MPVSLPISLVFCFWQQMILRNFLGRTLILVVFCFCTQQVYFLPFGKCAGKQSKCDKEAAVNNMAKYWIEYKWAETKTCFYSVRVRAETTGYPGRNNESCITLKMTVKATARFVYVRQCLTACRKWYDLNARRKLNFGRAKPRLDLQAAVAW